VAPEGKLEDDIEAAEYVDFIDLIDDDELERFGLHNGMDIGAPSQPAFLPLTGDDDDETLIDAKWEGLALAPALDDENPDDYFLISAVRFSFLSAL
jgi:hypothetical protein